MKIIHFGYTTPLITWNIIFFFRVTLRNNNSTVYGQNPQLMGHEANKDDDGSDDNPNDRREYFTQIYQLFVKNPLSTKLWKGTARVFVSFVVRHIRYFVDDKDDVVFFLCRRENPEKCFNTNYLLFVRIPLRVYLRCNTRDRRTVITSSEWYNDNSGGGGFRQFLFWRGDK